MARQLRRVAKRHVGRRDPHPTTTRERTARTTATTTTTTTTKPQQTASALEFSLAVRRSRKKWFLTFSFLLAIHNYIHTYIDTYENDNQSPLDVTCQQQTLASRQLVAKQKTAKDQQKKRLNINKK